MYPILQPNRENVKQGTWTEMPKFFYNIAWAKVQAFLI